MPEPHVPGSADDSLDLPCGETIHPHTLDLGTREISCDCGKTHAVVMDVHPLGRFVPEFLVETLRSAITTDDDFEEFSMAHALAMVREERPDAVAVADCSGDGEVGYGLVWVADFPARELHRTVVELVVELMEHAVGHVEDDTAVTEFETQLAEFDPETFVDIYRRERDFDDEYDTAV